MYPSRAASSRARRGGNYGLDLRKSQESSRERRRPDGDSVRPPPSYTARSVRGGADQHWQMIWCPVCDSQVYWPPQVS